MKVFSIKKVLAERVILNEEELERLGQILGEKEEWLMNDLLGSG